MLLGCQKKAAVEQLQPQSIFEKYSTEIDENPSPAGYIFENRYIDQSEYFSVEVPADWTFEIGARYSGLHLRMEQQAEEAAVEIWSFQGVQYKPAPRDECVWAFVDKGLYREWGFVRSVNVATCHPLTEQDQVIYGYLFHQYGRTWQLEAHVNRDNLVAGQIIAIDLLQSIQWSDAEGHQRSK